MMAPHVQMRALDVEAHTLIAIVAAAVPTASVGVCLARW